MRKSKWKVDSPLHFCDICWGCFGAQGKISIYSTYKDVPDLRLHEPIKNLELRQEEIAT